MSTLRSSTFSLALTLALSVGLFAQNTTPGVGLAAGLTANDGTPAGVQTPAEVKVNEGTPKLEFSMSSGGGKKISTRYKEKQGFLLLKSGERLDGFITLRTEQYQKEPAKISQVEFRESEKVEKRKLPPEQLLDFTFTFKMADTKKSGDPSRNFAKGVLTLADGTALRGFVAMAQSSANVWYAADERADVQEFSPVRLSTMVQSRTDGDFHFMTYRRVFVPVVVKGENLLMFRNPFPTTQATGLSAGLRNVAGQAMESVASQTAAEGAAKREAKSRAEAGENVNSIVGGAAAAGAQAGQQTADSFAGNDYRGKKPEYIIRNLKTGAEAIITDESELSVLNPLLDACPTTAKLSRKEREKEAEFKKLPALVAVLDKCF